MEEFKRIKELLYGINYEVHFHVYGPIEISLSLESALNKFVSDKCQVSGVLTSSPESAMNEILEMVLYKGESNSGPIDLDNKSSEIKELIHRVFTHLGLSVADVVSAFGFRKGHPSYAVFWDFAYDIHSNGARWIFIGSSSD